MATGIKVATMKLSKHLPSHMSIAGHKVFVSYEGQPFTFYGCGDTDHMHQACPNRLRDVRTTAGPSASSWTHVLANGPQTKSGAVANLTDPVFPCAPREQSQVHHAEKLVSEKFPGHSPNGMDRENTDDQNRAETYSTPGMGTTTLPAKRPQTRLVEVEDAGMEISNGGPMTTNTRQTREHIGGRDEGTAMAIENEPEGDSNQGEHQPPLVVYATTGDRAAAEDASNNSSRSKKLKLENGTEGQNEPKLSITDRQTQERKNDAETPLSPTPSQPDHTIHPHFTSS